MLTIGDRGLDIYDTITKQMNNPKVFTDFHHSSLLNSLIMLFEGRLGGQVYRPIGMEWAEKGYWKVYDHPATQAQYLGIGGATPDGSPKLNEVKGWVGEGIGRSLPGDGIVSRATDATVYYCNDIESGETNKAITFDGFMHLPIDIIIASLPQHIEPFFKLSKLHFNKPKVIYQIGNSWNIEGNMPIPNIMASAKIFIPQKYHSIVYHQEFSTEIYKPIEYIVLGEKWEPLPNIFSFVNCFSLQDHFRQDWQLFQELEQLMPNWVFKAYGGQCRDGAMNGSQALADKMREARFIWHTKNGGDGFGHVIHNAAAIGKPLIVKEQYYLGKLGGDLIKDGVTCITIDGLSPQEIINKINLYNSPENYAKLCKNTYENFKKVVDFDKEAEELKVFLDNLT